MLKVLFVCGKNKWRSPTAEEIFSNYPEIDCLSAGLAPESETVISKELLEWADLIFVMEKTHKTKLTTKFNTSLKDKRIICLNIPDNYKYMDLQLIKILTSKVTKYIK